MLLTFILLYDTDAKNIFINVNSILPLTILLDIETVIKLIIFITIILFNQSVTHLTTRVIEFADDLYYC